MEKLSQFISNHPLLWAALIGILFLILINEFINQKKKAKELSTQAAIDKINNEHAVVVDIRDKAAFNKAHIIGSIQATVEDFEKSKMNKYKEKPLIIVCERGVHASSAAVKLKNLGFQTYVLGGGLASWQGADLPTIKGN